MPRQAPEVPKYLSRYGTYVHASRTLPRRPLTSPSGRPDAFAASPANKPVRPTTRLRQGHLGSSARLLSSSSTPVYFVQSTTSACRFRLPATALVVYVLCRSPFSSATTSRLCPRLAAVTPVSFFLLLLLLPNLLLRSALSFYSVSD